MSNIISDIFEKKIKLPPSRFIGTILPHEVCFSAPPPFDQQTELFDGLGPVLSECVATYRVSTYSKEQRRWVLDEFRCAAAQRMTFRNIVSALQDAFKSWRRPHYASTLVWKQQYKRHPIWCWLHALKDKAPDQCPVTDGIVYLYLYLHSSQNIAVTPHITQQQVADNPHIQNALHILEILRQKSLKENNHEQV